MLKQEWHCQILGGFQVFIIPAGFIFDGASIPRLFWSILSPTGYLFLAGLIHDFIYKHKFLWVYTLYGDGDAGSIYKEVYSRDKADKKFEDLAKILCQQSWFRTWISLKGLKLFGSYTWNKFRKKNLKCDLYPKDYNLISEPS